MIGIKTKISGSKSKKEKKLDIKTKIIGTNIIFKLPRAKGDVTFHLPYHHFMKVD